MISFNLYDIIRNDERKEFYKQLTKFIYSNGNIDNEYYGAFYFKNNIIVFPHNKIINSQFTFHTHPKINKDCFYSFPSQQDINTIFTNNDVKLHVIFHRQYIYVIRIHEAARTEANKKKTLESLEKLKKKTTLLKTKNLPNTDTDIMYVKMYNETMQSLSSIEKIFTVSSHTDLYKTLYSHFQSIS